MSEIVFIIEEVVVFIVLFHIVFIIVRLIVEKVIILFSVIAPARLGLPRAHPCWGGANGAGAAFVDDVFHRIGVGVHL